MTWKPHWWVVVLAGLASVVTVIVLHAVSPEFGSAQVAHSLDRFKASELNRGIAVDYLFMAAYGLFGWTLFSQIRDKRDYTRPVHPAAAAAIFIFVGGVIADIVEDIFLKRALDADSTRALSYMRACGLVKWSLLATAGATFLMLCVLRVWRERPPPGLPTRRPEAKPDWDPPANGQPRIGVCLSGGGVRSAAFALGAMQALDDNEKLDKAAYLAAASGGGYLAAGWAVARSNPPGDNGAGGPKRWSQWSPEERWLRDNASYLIPDAKGGLQGLGRLLAGVMVNLLIVWLVLFIAARAVGWPIYFMHDDLRASDPTVLVRKPVAETRIQSFVPLDVPRGTAQSSIARYIVLLTSEEGARGEACFDEHPYKRNDREHCVRVIPDRAGLIDVIDGKAEVVRQPTVKLDRSTLSAQCEPNDRHRVECMARIEQQPELKLKKDRPVGDNLVADVEIGQPRVTARTGLAAAEYPSYKPWMWETSLGLIGGGLLVALGVVSLRLRRRSLDVTRRIARALFVVGLGAFVVMIALPWLVVWLPRTLDHVGNSSVKPALTQAPSKWDFRDYLLPGGGLLSLFIAATRQFLAAGRTGAGVGPSKPWYRGPLAFLTKRSVQLKWYEWSPAKVIAAVLVYASGAVVFLNAVQNAAGNGPKGRVLGFAPVRPYLPDWVFLDDWMKVGVAVAGLTVFALVADAQTWSLYPFYKRRLSWAFILRRKDKSHAEPIPYAWLLPFSRPRGQRGFRLGDSTPQFIACCAVNLSEPGVVPPGRRSASFTFSSTEIGGPIVGYASPDEYWTVLPLARRRDITVPSAMAISGAAFSPAMGKFNLGPLGSVLALANLRLGVWIASPRRVVEEARRGYPHWYSEWQWWRFGRPHWPWFLRELTNKYALNRRYLYVSDGGHWDNLALVELLRRGCTEIYCISAAGDGAESFGTIGEAVALAREELGVDIDLDPSGLRPPATAPKTPPDRELRREGAKDKAQPFATRAFVEGTFTYKGSHPDVHGKLFYVETDVTATMPFDVHVFAEAEPAFPDESTGDQVFNHRQFESYRELGYYQVAQIFAPRLSKRRPPVRVRRKR